MIRALVVGLVAGMLAVAALGGVGSVAEAVKAPSTIPVAVQFRGTTDVTFKQPADKTWYECGRLTIPVGSWRLTARAMVHTARPPTDLGTVSAFMALTTATGIGMAGVSDRDLHVAGRNGGGDYRAIYTLDVEKVVTLLARTTYRLVIQESEGGNWDQLSCLGERSTTIIRAERLG